MQYAVRRFAARVREDKEAVLPAGWEPIGGEIEGGTMYLVLARPLDEAEQAEEARKQGIRTKLKPELPESLPIETT